MSTVTPGTSGTIKSATAEGQLLEILTFIRTKEQSTTINPAGTISVRCNYDLNSNLFSGTYDFAATLQLQSDGSLKLMASPYLQGPGFQVGTGGTFKSGAAEAYALEVLMYLQNLEQTGANTQNRNFITGTYNSDTGRYAGSFSVPIATTIDAATGAVIHTATEYLSD